MNNYYLNKEQDSEKTESLKEAFGKMVPILAEEKKGIITSITTVILNSGLTLVGPLLIGYVIDTFIQQGNMKGVLTFSGILLAVYAAAFIANYVQMRVMGAVAQRTLWRLRNDVFSKLMELPLAFFNQNKSGDLISRINNDTDKLNQFFSEGLMRFVGSLFIVLGSGIFILFINWKLALAALIPAAVTFAFTWIVSPTVKKRTRASLKATGTLTADAQESMTNFKVILAFNRRDYFAEKFAEVNEKNYKAAIHAGVGNEIFTPIFEWASNLGLLIVLGYGIFLISNGAIAIGVLVSFVMYVTRFYDPLREMARMWSTFQTALAAWDRVGEILHLKSNLEVIESSEKKEGKGVIAFEKVFFSYPDGDTVLKDANFIFEKGKTYALVGPTGGGKTTTASLIARLYDPTSGTVFLDGKDIRSYAPEVRSQKIGFILQEPFLFSGTVRENIVYGNSFYDGDKMRDLEKDLKDSGLSDLLVRFDEGLETKVGNYSSLSLGQRQLIAFIRAVLRKPEILILDEATANIDTVTEKLLEAVLEKLPKETARVIIAHRLNTIENADGIFFVNSGEVTEAGSMEHAVEMLLHHKRTS
ncbi:MAG: ATP-binding cassette, subfamily bacterial [Patescibacteria group bacterium]|nr:ATP-binding cassette, subfamily bacterial [Patescibacteria group bacterium]